MVVRDNLRNIFKSCLTSPHLIAPDLLPAAVARRIFLTPLYSWTSCTGAHVWEMGRVEQGVRRYERAAADVGGIQVRSTKLCQARIHTHDNLRNGGARHHQLIGHGVGKERPNRLPCAARVVHSSRNALLRRVASQ